MRIIGGEAGGRLLFVPKGHHARPTSDKIKEALFNILQILEGKAFLDLFAGCGSIGIEALSRGAAQAMFIEKNGILVRAVWKNLRDCGYLDRARVIQADVAKGLGRLKKEGMRFDIIFADPPYETGHALETLSDLRDGRLLQDGGTVIIQHSWREDIPENPSRSWQIIDKRRYGETAMTFLQFNGEKENIVL